MSDSWSHAFFVPSQLYLCHIYKQKGGRAWSHRLIDVAVNESAPVSRITRQVVK